MQSFEALSRLVADQPEVHLGLGNAYRATKQWERSKAELDRVLAAQTLGSLGTREDSVALARLSSDRDPATRLPAARALSLIHI